MPSHCQVRLSTCLLSGLLFFLLILSPAFLNAENLSQGYVGAGRCGKCHAKEYDEWRTSGHARIIHGAHDAEFKGIPLPQGYRRADISYIIGGFRWKALFLDDKGYLITSTPEGPGKNQYSIAGRQWVDYLPGERIRYDCGGCHTTGFSPEGRQRGLEGIVGTWRFEGVQCEACHGPGGKHARNGRKDDVVINTGVCVNCHGKKPLDEIPLRRPFIEEYTEANQLLKSAMGAFSCTVCHNPHPSSPRSIRQNCESCHQESAGEYKGSYMQLQGVKCIDCHMPFATIIADGNPEIYKGDFRSHLFKVDHRKDFPSVERDGRRINPGYLSVDYACMPCHSLSRNRAWAVRFGIFAHTISVTTDIKIMRLQRILTYVGLLFAFSALLTGLNLKNYLLPSLQLNKKKVLTFHRFSAWTSFSIFTGNVILCLFFHFPIEQPIKALDYGWFLIHPVNGIIGAIFYGGKIFIVRVKKRGWTLQGLFWGAAIFLFWLIQLNTILFRAGLQ
ncbi:MAG: cytochrome c3 family protein [Nitrospirota bacterium]